MIFFWADMHFYHYLMAKLRGYCDIEEEDSEVLEEATNRMNETMILEWNSVVSRKDTVYHLGDLVIGNKPKTQEIIDRLNGNLCLIRGNHDHHIHKCSGVCWVKDTYMLKIKSDHELNNGGNMLIWLSHYAHRVWDRSHYGSLNFYAHSHGNLYDDPCSLSMDVGYDTSDEKKPYSLEEILYNIDMKLDM